MALTCREFIEFLGEYHSGSLDPRERSRFEAHLFECVECVEYLKSYEATIRLSKDAFSHPDEPVPTSVPDKLVRAILAARSPKAPP